MCITTATLVLPRLLKKADLLETKVNSMKERFIWTKLSFDLKKNRLHIPSGLGNRSIIVVRQKGRQNSGSSGFFKIQQIHSKACLDCLNGYGTNLIPISLQLAFKANSICV